MLNRAGLRCLGTLGDLHFGEEANSNSLGEAMGVLALFTKIAVTSRIPVADPGLRIGLGLGLAIAKCAVSDTWASQRSDVERHRVRMGVADGDFGGAATSPVGSTGTCDAFTGELARPTTGLFVSLSQRRLFVRSPNGALEAGDRGVRTVFSLPMSGVSRSRG